MPLFFKLLLLLWSINFAPPLLAILLETRWDNPLDGNYRFSDGRPVFGNHKTIRGVLAGIAAGSIVGTALGFPLWLALGAGILSMCGDLLSSFLKRRLSFTSGEVVPGIDQVPEGFLPFLLLGPYLSLSMGYVLFLGLTFGTGAHFGSIFLNTVLMRRPFASYPRKVRPLTRIRELISCRITAHPFNYMLNFEDAFYYHIFMKTVFMLIGILERGKKNALVIEKREVTFDFPDLPPAFDGYKVLFLSDLHLDALEGLTEITSEIVRDISADLCILGGDLRMETHGPFGPALKHMERLLPHLHATDGMLAVLGNHDCLEIVEPLNHKGVIFLVNNSLAIERNGQRIWIVGADDCHYFKSHDLVSAFQNVPLDDFAIFLSHSNEIYSEASQFHPKLYLCGHTHAGQVKIPPFGPIFTHSKAPRRMCEGRWDYNGMPGYTSAGVGISGVPVRFNSKGEVTVITLRRSEKH